MEEEQNQVEASERWNQFHPGELFLIEMGLREVRIQSSHAATAEHHRQQAARLISEIAEHCRLKREEVTKAIAESRAQLEHSARVISASLGISKEQVIDDLLSTDYR